MVIQFEKPAMYSFREMAQKRFTSSRSLGQGQRSNEEKTCPCTTTPLDVHGSKNLRSLLCIVSEKWPRQDLQVQGHWAKVKGQMRKKIMPMHNYPLDDHGSKCEKPAMYSFREMALTRFTSQGH